MTYVKNFLSVYSLPLPTVPKQKRRKLLKYTNFIICQNVVSRLPWYTAVNIEYKKRPNLKRKRDKWFYEDLLRRTEQLGEPFYRMSKIFDRGHLVRRLDPCWGPKAKQAELETFRFVNCAPQHRKLNRKMWLELEKNVLEKGTIDKHRKISVFTGPIFSNENFYFTIGKGSDKEHIEIPAMYWKIIVWQKTDQKLYAVGFIMSQWEYLKQELDWPVSRSQEDIDEYFENLQFKNDMSYQVNIAAIEMLTGLTFKWKKVIFPYNKREHTQLYTRKKLKEMGVRSASKPERKALRVDIENLVL